MNIPEVTVGLMQADNIRFSLHGTYTINGQPVDGEQAVCYRDGHIVWQGHPYQTLTFAPHDAESRFSLYNITIGLQFHWERQETQTFTGTLHLLTDDNGQIVAVNRLPVEAYLVSVISSEMKATSSLEFLKAHAVISRSWLLAQIRKRHVVAPPHTPSIPNTMTENEHERIRWYDREDHTLFDVCADDHCQRYQGIGRTTNPTVAEAVRATCGEVLMSEGAICDARFSKCCGGASETFDTCWEDRSLPYLSPVRDALPDTEAPLPDLTHEEEADRWIRTSPASLCHTDDPHILHQILNHYDQETTDFYRWKVTYTQDELSTLIRERSGIDFGHIVDLQPIERGASGRLRRLRIVGTRRTMVIGKELEIRRTLSRSHLFSSAFVVDKEVGEAGIPSSFTLVGAGWGHGVGLCQIGAAVMGEKGYSHRDILLHYYRGATLQKLY